MHRSLLLGWLLLSSVAQADTPWPYPEDSPTPSAATTGLAGRVPAGFTRYLVAQGASNAQISPDGRDVAFLWSISGEPQLWRVPAAGGQPEQLTFGGGVTDFAWAPNSATLLVARDLDGNEREGYTLLARDGTAERELLPQSAAFRSFGEFAIDGEQIVYASTERNGTDFDIYVADVADGSTKRVFDGQFGFFAAALRPGGNELLVSETRGEDANDLHILDLESGALRALLQPAVAAAFDSPVWRDDGTGFYTLTDIDREMAAIAFIDARTAEVDILVESATPIDRLAVCDAQRRLIYAINDNGFSRLGALDLETGRRLAVPELPKGVYDLDCARDARRATLRIVGPTTPGDIYLWDFAADTVNKLFTASLGGLDPARHFAEPTALTFPARDGVQLQGLLYLPRRRAPENGYPLVVQVHGGPTAQSRPTFRPIEQYLVNTGVAVFAVNVRGSTGFGKTYARLDNRERRLDSVRDLVDTVAFLSARDELDTSRAAVMGGSYGGYMVNAVLGSYPGVFQAGISIVGVSDWVRALEDASPGLKASDRIEYGDIREPRWRTFYSENSPINNVDAIDVPVLFSHGVNDPRDPVAESDRMVLRLRENGVPVRYLRFADEGHSVKKRGNRVALYQAIAGFLDQELSPDRSAGE
ncbi:MAG: S9 family peptidase [Pseudomonadota bacterium]